VRRLIVVAVGATALLMAGAPVQAQAPEPRTIVEGLEFPTGIAFHPDGRMFVNERAGRIRVIEGGRLVDAPVSEIPTMTSGETGLLGITLSPDEGSLYVFATEPDGGSNTVWRVDVGSGERERVVEAVFATRTGSLSTR
jgi:glucose/arabinose dehydrogenase